jgi:uncharacterized membrane protein YtjA (UPF0391 family)
VTGVLVETEGGVSMLYWALVFLVIAVILAILGFGVAAAAFAGVAKLLFYIFLIAFVISLIMHMGRRRI